VAAVTADTALAAAWEMLNHAPGQPAPFGTHAPAEAAG
jgi:hypothetical protein